jgi:tetratricopeptide (TPR) repeat protein
LEAANIALLVHLLGAGGIAMPAITQLLWLVWVLRAALSASDGGLAGETSSSEIGAASVSSEHVWLGLTAVALVMSGACLKTGTLPELTCRTKLGLGDVAWEVRNVESGLEKYKAAAVADRFSLEPLERQAELAAQRAEQTNQSADIDAADEVFRTLIGKQPFAPHPHRRLGQFWLSRFERTRDAESARRAAEAFAGAVERYPYHASLLSEWALACDGAGRLAEARDAARRALRQDDLNRQVGHVDKFLSPKVRQQVEDLAAVSDLE